MPEMTKEDRVECALSREEPDRVPLYDLLDNVRVHEHYAGRPVTLENAWEIIPLAVSRVLDTTRCWLPAAPGRRTDERGWVFERVDWWNEWRVTAPFADLQSLTAYVGEEIEGAEAWQPAEPQAKLDELVLWQRRFGDTLLPANTAGEALADAYIPIGIEWFVTLAAEDPGLVRRWLSALHVRTLRRLQAEGHLRQVSPVVWLFADLAYKGRTMFAPDTMRTYGVFARIAEICHLYHSQGFKVIFHSDGFIRPIVPDLIAAGVDALAPIEVEAGLDLAELKSAFGDQVAFVGGINVAELLRFGSADDVRRATLRALAVAGPGGGFILGSSSEELFDALPPENIITMFETTRECGHYPIGSSFPKSFEWR